MSRRSLPPDFRYVWLHRGSNVPVASLATGVVGFAGVSTAFFSAGSHPLAMGVMLAGSILTVLGLARAERRRIPLGQPAREVDMAVVPWGVIVDPDTEPCVLRWPAVQHISVEVAHTMRGGTPAVLSSVVTVQTERDAIAGRAAGAVGLERLLANLEDYAAEAARPVAADLEGTTPLGDGVTEPVVSALLEAADALCSRRGGAPQLLLPGSGYRSAAAQPAAVETLSLLRNVLCAGCDGPADPRPLAAVLAGVLGAKELVPELLRLGSSPHPVVAALGKAAALRLGAPPNRAGSLDEVAAFLFDEDLELGKRWVAEGMQESAAVYGA